MSIAWSLLSKSFPEPEMVAILEMLRNRRKRKDVYSSPEFWDGKAGHYSDSAISMFTNRRYNALIEIDQFAFIDSVLGNISGAHVLDVGAGTGRLSRHLARQGANVGSFDFAAAVVEIARRLNGALPIEAKVMSVFDLDEVEAFDHAAVLGCLSAACKDRGDLETAAERLYKAVRPGARVAIIEPFHQGHLHRVLDMPLNDVLDVFRAAGFAVTHRAELHFWPVRLFLAPVEWPGFITRALYHVGEAILRIAPARQQWGDYKGIGLVRQDAPR
ncbi:SAM-dependent methyltransferase [Bosea sp. OAE506]|uniref:class I SAM-dependent methyltransferase n=1 Tax=Bosea sp. OAE506 TaxID=2663870 RepID=UPI00178947CD